MNSDLKVYPFEEAILSQELKAMYSPDQISDILKNAEIFDYHFSGAGYFLEMRHPLFPTERDVIESEITANADGWELGFLIFLQDKELCLECYLNGDSDGFPDTIRTEQVKLMGLN